MSAPRFAGDVDVNKVAIVGASGYFDITKITIGIDVYENIFFPFVRGIITINDAQDTLNLINFKEREYLELDFNTPDKKGYKSTYYIYKVSDRVKSTDKSVIYRIYFTHISAISELVSKISQNFNDKHHIIAEKIIKAAAPRGLEYSDKIEVEESVKNIQFVAGNWTPTQTIYYLTKYAVNAKNNPAYLFYQNNEGYHFKSFDKLIEQEPKEKYKYDNYDHAPENSCALKNFDEHYKRILTINFPQLFNFSYESMMGVFSALSMHYDNVKKQYVATKIDDNWNKVDHLNPEQKIVVVPKKNEHASHQTHGQIEYGFNDQEDNTNIPTKQEREAIFARYARSKISMSVFGNSELYAGNVVELEVIKHKPLDESTGTSEGMIDKTYSGKYIISSIGHHIDKENYETHLELIRDSFLDNEEEKKEEKKDDTKKEKPTDDRNFSDRLDENERKARDDAINRALS